MASNTITIICAVAAEFKLGDNRFNVTAKDRGIVLQAPEWIKETRMFKWLSSDGSLKYVTPANKIQLENEPMLGLNAEGKEIKAEVKQEKEPVKAEEPEKVEEPVVAEVVEAIPAEPKRRNTRTAKKDDVK